VFSLGGFCRRGIRLVFLDSDVLQSMTKQEDDKRHKYAFMMSAHRDAWVKFGRKQFGAQFAKDRAHVRSAFAATSSPEAASKLIKSYFQGPAHVGWMAALKIVWVETGKASIEYMHNFLTGKSYGFKQDDPLIEDIQSTWEQRVSDRIKTSFKDKIKGITDTTQDDVHNTIADGVADGKGHYEIGKLVDDKLDETWPGRGETISRTEAGSAMNRATLEDANAMAPDLYKKWAATMVNTRETHQDADAGDAIPQDEQFDVGDDSMDCPGDESASPEEIINCGCCLLFVPAPDEEKPAPEEPAAE
jgi:hypothetical protein